MLYETKGDPGHPDRNGSKTTPARADKPQAYAGLLSWYEDWCAAEANRAFENGSLLSLVVLEELWAEEHAHGYVERLHSKHVDGIQFLVSLQGAPR
jgi:hypothetical protein